jgi:HK97 family phage major capsid protein
MDDKTKEKVDGAIEEAVAEVKKEETKSEDLKKMVEDEVKKQIPAKIAFGGNKIENLGDPKFSWARLIKAVAAKDWSNAGFEEEVCKAYPQSGLYNTTNVGDVLVPPEYSKDIINLLNAKAVVRAAGARVLDVNTDTFYIPKQTVGATTAWIGENTSLTADATTNYAQVEISNKKAYSLVGISNELLNDSSPAVEQLVREDLVTQLALLEDKSMLHSQSNAPVGLLYTHASGYANFEGSTAGTSCWIKTNYLYSGQAMGASAVAGGAAPTFDNIMDAQYLVQAQNSSVTAWVMHPRSMNSLRKIQSTATGEYVFHEGDLSKGTPATLLGIPIYYTTQIGITYDDATNSGAASLSYIIGGDWKELMIGQRQGILLKASDQVGFQYDATWIRATLRVGWAPRHEQSFVAILDVAA